jgi:tripartite-type tricarboxylate transporter receptor subunit TctC
MGGQIAFTFADNAVAFTQIRAGKLRGLGVTTLKRAPALPAVPTLNEAGLPGFVSNTWHGLVAPGGTPAAVIQRLNAACTKVLRMPEVVSRLQAEALEAAPMSAEAFGAFMRAERVKWGRVIREHAVRLDT